MAKMVDAGRMIFDTMRMKNSFGADAIEIDGIVNYLQENGEEAEPVKHGKWIKGVDKESELHVAECTACGYQNGLFGYGANYCPNCGAKMEK